MVVCSLGLGECRTSAVLGSESSACVLTITPCQRCDSKSDDTRDGDEGLSRSTSSHQSRGPGPG